MCKDILAVEATRLYENAWRYHNARLAAVAASEHVIKMRKQGYPEKILREGQQRADIWQWELNQAEYAIRFPQFA